MNWSRLLTAMALGSKVSTASRNWNWTFWYSDECLKQKYWQLQYKHNKQHPHIIDLLCTCALGCKTTATNKAIHTYAAGIFLGIFRGRGTLKRNNDLNGDFCLKYFFSSTSMEIVSLPWNFEMVIWPNNYPAQLWPFSPHLLPNVTGLGKISLNAANNFSQYPWMKSYRSIKKIFFLLMTEMDKLLLVLAYGAAVSSGEL